MEKKSFQRLIHTWMEETVKKPWYIIRKKKQKEKKEKEKEELKEKEKIKKGVFTSHNTRACPRILFVLI